MAMNLFAYAGAFVLQYLVGELIDLFPPTGLGSYPPAAYRLAFAVMIALEAASWL